MNKNSGCDTSSVKIHNKVIASIASIAAMENEGVKQIGRTSGINLPEILGFRGSSAITVTLGKNEEISLQIPLVIKYGYNIPEVAEKVQESVRQALERMMDKTPRDICISIQGIEK